MSEYASQCEKCPAPAVLVMLDGEWAEGPVLCAECFGRRAASEPSADVWTVGDIFTAVLCTMDSREAAARVIEYLRKYHPPAAAGATASPTLHDESPVGEPSADVWGEWERLRSKYADALAAWWGQHDGMVPQTITELRERVTAARTALDTFMRRHIRAPVTPDDTRLREALRLDDPLGPAYQISLAANLIAGWRTTRLPFDTHALSENLSEIAGVLKRAAMTSTDTPTGEE